MDGKQLKNSILQWAIQGKLVPQNPKDEPAQKLLERIAASRNGDEPCHPERSAKGTKSKDLKKKKSAPSSRIYRENGVWYEQIGSATPKDITDEIPFEIPETWAWCRFNSICDIARGGSPRPIQNYLTDSPEGYNWIKIGDTEKGGKYINSTKERIKPEGLTKTRLIHKGDFLLTNSMSFGRPYIANIDGCIHDGWLVMSILGNAFVPDYLYYLLSSPYAYHQFCGRVAGAVVKNLNIDKVAESLIPLPPLAEQKRIVAKLEQVLPLAEEYGAAQEQLDKLNKELPEAIKKSILQEAIQGKLVPQNPKDEPAQKLLERIALARHSERSEESSKRSKKTSKDQSSRIYRENGVWYEQIGTAAPKDITDEIPFEIPENWAWCRLGNCSDYAASKEKAKSFENIQEMWSLDLEDIEKNSGRIVKRLRVCERKIVGEKVVFKKGQVLYSKLRPYLKKILVAPEDGVCSSEIVPFSPFEYLDADYLVTVLKSPHVDYTINLVTYGVKMPRVGTATMLNLLIPLPPLAEQKRIVAKLEQLFKVL